MCDYSLQAFKSRPAKVGDKLETWNFGTGTTGFITTGEDGMRDTQTAICVLPGTELTFDGAPEFTACIDGNYKATCDLAIFRQENKEFKTMHHDILEFADGTRCMLTQLRPGAMATVLQLPAEPKNEVEKEEQRRAEFV